MTASAPRAVPPGTAAPRQSRLLRALRREPVDCTPVWFMRQAGRSLPEYRKIREKYSLLEICRHPDVCAEVTVQPVRRLGVDAAILYADIMNPLVGIGIDLDIVEKVGPVIAHPLRTSRDVTALRPLTPDDVRFVVDDIRCTRALLDREVPLLGFSGAPFTLASYLIEGRPSRDFITAKRMMYRDPELWHDVMRRLSIIVATYMRVQAAAGVDALQLFDSWIGALSVDDYARYVQPHVRGIFVSLADLDIPVIHFGTGTGALLESMRDAGGTTIGVDWRVRLDLAWERIGFDRGIQGNLDPLVLQGPWEVVERESTTILDRSQGRHGHVFNVGHGIHPETSPNQLQRLVEFVHEHSARSHS